MVKYSYKKESLRKIYYVNGKPVIDNIIVHKDGKNNQYRKTLLDNISSRYNSSPYAGVIIPLILILTGVFFIYRQFFPDIRQFIESNSGYLTQGNISPVSDSYVNYDIYLSNPAGLPELTNRALSENILTIDAKSLGYTGVFYISIPSLGMDRLPVEANVDSSTEESYNAALKDSLAHFRNTGLPFSEIQNNIVIYGHSASPSYNPRRNDPEVALSYLSEIKVGDEIIIEMEGVEYRYVMFKSKIVNADDTSIITGTKGRRTLTLFTCYPAGNNSQRYVALAREV